MNQTFQCLKKIKIFLEKIKFALIELKRKEYWNKANFVEALGFLVKLLIIIPGLLFGYQWWWLYIFAIISSVSLIWSSTIKTLPTVVIFNVIWILLAITAIIKYFV